MGSWQTDLYFDPLVVLKEVPASVAANPRKEVGSSIANYHLDKRVDFLSFPGRSLLNVNIKNHI